MTIENLMVETNQVELFAVCCTENLTVEALNRFFTEVQQQERTESAVPILTLVHTLDHRVWGATTELQGEDKGWQSPFLGRDFAGIRQALQQMDNTAVPTLNKDWFLVLDAQSEPTSSAVIVNVEDENIRSVRVAYAVSSRYLSAASVSSPPIDELIEISDESGGILHD